MSSSHTTPLKRRWSITALASSLCSLSACSLMIDTDALLERSDEMAGAQLNAGLMAGAGATAGVGEPVGGDGGGEPTGGAGGGEPMGGVGGGEPMGGVGGAEPTGGVGGEVPTGGVGGEVPLIVSERLEPHLPSPSCLAWSDEEGCLAYVKREDPLSCAAYQSAVSLTPRPVWVGTRDACDLGDPSPQDLDATLTTLNLLRDNTHQPPLTLTADQAHSLCALAALAEETATGWAEGALCYLPELSGALTPSPRTLRFRGSWSIHDALSRLMSGTHINGVNPVYARHAMLSGALNELKVGQNARASCLGFIREGAPSQLPFSFYPGIGLLPLELITPGNHEGAPPLWSVGFEEQVAEAEVFVDNLTQGTSLTVNTSQLEQLVGLSLFSWSLAEEINAGDVLRVRVDWRVFLTSRSVELYLSFEGCGLTLPTSCDPLGSECAIARKRCDYRLDREPQWVCDHEGPLSDEEPCADLKGACAGERICVTNETNFPSGLCSERCDPTTSMEPESCDQRCPPLNGRALDLPDGSTLGVCLP